MLLTVAPHKKFASAHPAQIHDIDCTLQCHQFSDFTICSNILIDRKSKYYYLYCSVYYEQECWEPLKVARRCFGGAGVAIWEQLDIARLRFHANWACYIFFTWPMYCCMYSSVPNKRLGQISVLNWTLDKKKIIVLDQISILDSALVKKIIVLAQISILDDKKTWNFSQYVLDL